MNRTPDSTSTVRTPLYEPTLVLAAIATTPQGARALMPLVATFKSVTLWVPPAVATLLADEGTPSGIKPDIKSYSGSLKQHLADLWSHHQAFVCCLAMGAVVRLIAPLLQDKRSDPAVIVLDESSQYVISVCSGHQGQADDLTRWISTQLNATPVLTGAANGDRRLGIDLLGRPYGWQLGRGDWTGLSAAIARRESIHVVQEAGSTLWQQHLPANHTYVFPSPTPSNPHPSPYPPSHPSDPTLWISPRKRPLPPSKLKTQNSKLKTQNSKLPHSPTPPLPHSPPPPLPPQAQWHPRVLWVGIGCERDTPRIVIETAIQQACQRYQLAEAAIAGIATLDLKADETGLLELCGDRHWPLRCFTAAQLQAIDVPNPSPVVEQAVGTASVAEAAALVAASASPSMLGLLVSTQLTPDSRLGFLGSTQPTATPTLLAPKYIHRISDQPGAVTVAIAQADHEYIGRIGKLALVGIGPGQLDQITPAAQGAIVQADAVIGYGLYIDLIRPLLRPGQIVEALPITQERQRAERAIALAQWGLSVAVISSGDCGIYGMAGLVMEQLQQNGWNGQAPSVQVFPGVTALQAAAARVGSPLMHDFCAISLSDLLTPWEVIEKRLDAAARADFVTALYNPKSKTRLKQIAIAHRIFLTHRPPHTPVALVRSAYRHDEQITLTTLDRLLESSIDMMTLVLIGNNSTRRLEQWLITPRGYLTHQE